MVDENIREVLSCIWWDDILCSYRKSERVGYMGRCEKCRHFLRFLAEMAEEDEKEAEAIEELERFHVAYLRGDISEDEYRQRYQALTYDDSE